MMRKHGKDAMKRGVALAAYYIHNLPTGCDYYQDAINDEGVELDIPIDNEFHFWKVAELLNIHPPTMEGEMYKRLGALTIMAYMMPVLEEEDGPSPAN